jgi:uncharacterized membrane protein
LSGASFNAADGFVQIHAQSKSVLPQSGKRQVAMKRKTNLFLVSNLRPSETFARMSDNKTLHNGEKTSWLHWALTVALAVVLALEMISLLTPWKSGWLDAALIVLACASSMTALSRQLPVQNVLFGAFIIAIVGGTISAVGEMFRIPFGSFLVGAESGPRIFGTAPWAMPLIWVTFILNSRGVARLILRPWRKTKTYGFRLIGLATALTAVFEFAFEPFATRVKHFWFWERTQLPISWQGAPLVNFFSWAAITVLILAFVTPLLINKQLSKRRSPDFHPLFVWVGAMLLFAIGAATEKTWAVAAVDVAIGIVTAIFAIRGARW